MLSVVLDLEDSKCIAVNTECIVLENDYDHRQEWLPFVCAMVARRKPKTNAKFKPLKLSRFSLFERMDRPYAILKQHDYELYQYIKGVEQFVLPFENHRRVHDMEFARIKEAGYPGWDKIDGRPIRVKLGSFYYQWVEEISKSRYFHSGQWVIFERSEDAERFREFCLMTLPVTQTAQETVP